jgi:hypothetical protein
MGIELTRRRVAPCALLAVVLTIAGCAGDADGGTAGVVVDTIGDIVRVTNIGPGAWRDGDTWRLGRIVRIGAEPLADDPYAFGSITGITVADDGRIYVADGQALEIRVFSAAGEFLNRFGRSGEGPGEFGAIDALALTPEGEILARDPRQFRVTRFDPQGTYISQFAIRRPYQQYGAGLGFAVDRSGVIYDRLSISLGIESDDSLAIVRYEPDGTLHDTVHVAQSPRRLVNVVKDGRLVMGMSIPFSASATAVVGPDGTIARTGGGQYEFDLLAEDGAVRRTIVRDVEPVPVTATDRDSTLARMRERAREFADGGQLEEFAFPSAKAAITHMSEDSEGHWWVGASGASSRLVPPDSYDVFDSEGRLLGTVDVPFLPIEIGADYIAGVATDELGVQSVAVARLIRAPF